MRFDGRFWAGVLAAVLAHLPGWLQRCFVPRRGRAATGQTAQGLLHSARHGATHDAAHQQALALVRAVDAGGVPLHPARVNQIARQLGLEVSSAAPVHETVARIRDALVRLG